MIVLVTLTVGLVIWVVAWTFGIKAFDAFLFTAIITVVAAAAQMVMPAFRRMRAGETAPGER